LETCFSELWSQIEAVQYFEGPEEGDVSGASSIHDKMENLLQDEHRKSDSKTLEQLFIDTFQISSDIWLLFRAEMDTSLGRRQTALTGSEYCLYNGKQRERSLSPFALLFAHFIRNILPPCRVLLSQNAESLKPL
jgi:hypothetical protein